MVLRVAQSGAATTLTLPPGVPVATARAFLLDHEAWLRRNLAARPLRVTVGDGAVLPFGDDFLKIRSTSGKRLIHGTGELLVPGPPEAVPCKVAAFLCAAAREACVAATDHHAAALGRRVGRITLRDPRSRWGSCTSGGDLMYSWRLILAPRDVLDYVVAHEVAHLAEMNHSERFWRVVRDLCPGFEAPRDWLRRKGAGLHAYDFGQSDAA